jgi:hypothetical protein
MKRFLNLALFLLVVEVPAHAQFDATIAAAQLAEQKAYDAWMHIQIVQQLVILTQTYNASVDYINQWKQLNTGKGILFNVGEKLEAAQNQETKRLSQQFLATVNARGTAPAKVLFDTIDQTVATSIKYTGDEMANVATNRQIGVNIASNAGSLAPRDAANQSARAQGLEIQMLTQLHEDNLRIIQLVSLQLSAQARPAEGQETMMQNIKQSVQNRYPTATLDTEAGQ